MLKITEGEDGRLSEVFGGSLLDVGIGVEIELGLKLPLDGEGEVRADVDPVRGAVVTAAGPVESVGVLVALALVCRGAAVGLPEVTGFEVWVVAVDQVVDRGGTEVGVGNGVGAGVGVGVGSGRPGASGVAPVV